MTSPETSAESAESIPQEPHYGPIGEVVEVVEDHEEHQLVIRIKHTGFPTNDKTFKFDTENGLTFEKMLTEKGKAWNWTQGEILTLPGVYYLAWETAVGRYHE